MFAAQEVLSLVFFANSQVKGRADETDKIRNDKSNKIGLWEISSLSVCIQRWI